MLSVALALLCDEFGYFVCFHDRGSDRTENLTEPDDKMFISCDCTHVLSRVRRSQFSTLLGFSTSFSSLHNEVAGGSVDVGARENFSKMINKHLSRSSTSSGLCSDF